MNLSYNTIYTFIMASLGKAQSKKEKKKETVKWKPCLESDKFSPFSMQQARLVICTEVPSVKDGVSSLRAGLYSYYKAQQCRVSMALFTRPLGELAMATCL